MAVEWKALAFEEDLYEADENRTLKAEVKEKQAIGTGVWYTLANITGGAGEGVMIWLAIDPTQDGDHSPSPDGDVAWKHELRITIDGTVRVDTIVGNFFASTYGSPRWTTDNIGCDYMRLADTSGASSFYRYVSIPFGSSLKVEIKNASSNNTNIWSTIEYYDEAGSYGARSDKFRCATLEAQSVLQYASKDLVDISGKGRLEGFMLAVDGNSNYSFLEGDIIIEVDGSADIHYSGTEDTFLGAFYWGDVKWQTSRTGMTKQHTRTDLTDVFKICAYRFFIDGEQIPFDTSLKITWYNGETVGSPGTVEMYSDVWYYLE